MVGRIVRLSDRRTLSTGLSTGLATGLAAGNGSLGNRTHTWHFSLGLENGDGEPMPGPEQSAAYPFAGMPMVPQWSSGRARLQAVAAVLAVGAGLTIRWPIKLAEVDDVVLRIGFPAFLAFVLAFAPQPAGLLGRIAKDLTTASLISAVFAGHWLPLMIASFPLVLAAAVVLSESELGRRIWPKG
jgi:hypothetical protein